MKRKSNRKAKRSHAKTILRLPDLEIAKTAVINSLSCPDAQRGYRHAIDEFVDWYCSEPRLSFSKTVVVRYRMHLESRHLAPGTINLRLGAVRRLAYEAADSGLLSADLAAGIRRDKGVKKLGVRLGNWLTPEQGNALWQAPNSERLRGKRDRALLAILLACGLRRHEIAELTLDHFQKREEHWAIVDLVGKGGHIRTIPVPDWVYRLLNDWMSAAGIQGGRLFRKVSSAGKPWGDGVILVGRYDSADDQAGALISALREVHAPKLGNDADGHRPCFLRSPNRHAARRPGLASQSRLIALKDGFRPAPVRQDACARRPIGNS